MARPLLQLLTDLDRWTSSSPALTSAPRRHRGRWFLGMLVLLCASVAPATTPVPTRFPGQGVYDVAQVIDAETEERLELLQRELWEKARVAIVVVTVDALRDEEISDFAVRVGQSWGVGAKGQDRGLVVALSTTDRAIFVATGYGTEHYLPDGRVGALIDEYALPPLRAGEPSLALWQLVSVLAEISAEEFGAELSPAARSPTRSDERRLPSALRWLLLSIGAAAFLYLAIRHPRLLLLALFFLSAGRGRRGGGGHFGGGGGLGGFAGGGGFGGGGAGRRF